MIVRIHSASGVPIYVQIESQVKQSIAAGALAINDPLPPVRRLAAELRVNPNTVARAYQNLERDGVIRTVPGGGCYVNEEPPGLLPREKIRRLKPIAMQLAVEARQLVFAREDAMKLLEQSFDELGDRS
jgi:GntR family transcriptional regulator